MSDDPMSRCAQEIEFLKAEIDALKNRIGEASMILADWDGYYNPETGKGNVQKLADIIEDAFVSLQGKSWRAKMHIDPPQGWMYGFPKPVDEKPEDTNKWLVDNGYPQHLVDYWTSRGQGVPCNMFFR